MDDTLLVATEEISTHDLVELVGHRLGVPAHGTGKVELTFNDGEWVGGNYGEKVKPFEQRCTCRRHAWSPTCPLHGREAAALP